jgi:hypothetical protein
MNNEEAAMRKRIKEIHSFSAWAKRIPGKASFFSMNVSIRKKDISDLEHMLKWELVKKKPMPIERPGCKCTQYLFKNPEPEKTEELILIRITECDSQSNAHESIIDFMMFSTAPKFPRGEETGLDIGDVCFGSYEKTPVSVLFTRDNFMVYVQSVGTDDVNVDKIAARIDEIIGSGVTVEPDVLLSMKEKKKTLPGKRKKSPLFKKTAGVGEKILLSIEGFDLKDEKLKCKISASGGRISRENEELYYCPEEPGKHKINILVFDEENNLLSSVDYEVSVSK